MNLLEIAFICLSLASIALPHTSHQVHAGSGRSYNTSFDAPREEGVDDVTGEQLEHSGAAFGRYVLSDGVCF